MEGGTCKPDRIDCNESSKPAMSQSCGNCRTQTRTMDCDYTIGNWQEGSWGSCSGEGVCKPGDISTCDNGKLMCGSSCPWGSCNSSYILSGGVCQLDCSNPSIRSANKSYCCSSYPDTDDIYYKDCTIRTEKKNCYISDYSNYCASVCNGIAKSDPLGYVYGELCKWIGVGRENFADWKNCRCETCDVVCGVKTVGRLFCLF